MLHSRAADETRAGVNGHHVKRLVEQQINDEKVFLRPPFSTLVQHHLLARDVVQRLGHDLHDTGLAVVVLDLRHPHPVVCVIQTHPERPRGRVSIIHAKIKELLRYVFLGGKFEAVLLYNKGRRGTQTHTYVCACCSPRTAGVEADMLPIYVCRRV